MVSSFPLPTVRVPWSSNLTNRASVLLSAFVCKPDLSNQAGLIFLVEGPSVECYTEKHVTMMIIAGVTLLLYYPLALRTMPVSDIMQRL